MASTEPVFKLLYTVALLAAAVTLLQLELTSTFSGAPLVVAKRALTLKSLQALAMPFVLVTDPLIVILLFTRVRSVESILLLSTTSKLAAGTTTVEKEHYDCDYN